MKKEMFVFAASLALISSMSASVIHSTATPVSKREISNNQSGLTLAREVQPGDDRRHGRGKDDKKGHKLMQEMAREVQPGDQRHGRGKDDKKGHKLMQEMAREVQPGDQRHGRGKDDKKGHKLMQEIAREAQPGDDRGHGRRRGHGKDDGTGHKVA